MSEHDKERIEKEAETYADDTNIDGSDFWQDMYLGYIAGATAENERMEELQKVLKELIPIAEDRLFAVPVKSLSDVVIILEKAKALLRSQKKTSD